MALALNSALVSFNLVMTFRFISTKSARRAPRERDSNPRTPVPANKSSTLASAISRVNQLNIVSLARSVVGLRCLTRATTSFRPLHLPLIIRTVFVLMVIKAIVVDSKKKNDKLWRRFKRSLTKTRVNLAEGIGDLVLGERAIDASALEELETSLLTTDVGIETTSKIISSLTGKVKRKELGDTVALKKALTEELYSIAEALEQPFEVQRKNPFVILMVGVNGAGKTTSTGKLASRLRTSGLKVLIAAGDTFRAGAIEQVKQWGDRNGIPVVAQQTGADSASVIYDAIESAKAQNIDVVIADTAGRLQTNKGLMDELSKIKRVVNRLDASAPHECLLVVDATIGQNVLSQVREFDEAVGLTGLIVTKLDGTAKAGVLFALSNDRVNKLPIYFVGLGEGIDDMEPFASEAYVEALLDLN